MTERQGIRNENKVHTIDTTAKLVEITV